MSHHRHAADCWASYEPCGEHHRHDYNCGGGKLKPSCPDYREPPPTYEELVEENGELHQLRERLAELLTGVAKALKGEPTELSLHDWSDLPTLAKAHAKVAETALAYVEVAHHADRCEVRRGRPCTCGKHALLFALRAANYAPEPTNPRDASAAEETDAEEDQEPQ